MTLAARLRDLVLSILASETSCVNWRATPPLPYGVVTFQGKRWYAHRFAFFVRHGRLPAQQIDHLCRNRICVNPNHMEDVSLTENVMRGESLPAQNAKKDACAHGHAFTPENTAIRIVRGRRWRGCRECLRNYQTRLRGRFPHCTEHHLYHRCPLNGEARAL